MAITLWNNRDLARRNDNLFAWPGFDHVIDNFFNGFLTDDFAKSQSAQMADFKPSLDLQETEKEFHVLAELPGVDEKNLDISLDKDVLTIKGEKKQETVKDSKDRYYSERRFGSFLRTIHLPNDVDKEHITAAFDKGLLKIVLPKSTETKNNVKKIKIH